MHSGTSLWSEQAPLPAALGRDRVPERSDVAIVGAGATGLRAARVLAGGGARVVVLDAGRLGGGATSRSGGQALLGLRDEASVLARRVGLGRARDLWNRARRALQRLPDLCESESISCGLERCGSLYLAARPAHFEDMKREADWLAHHFHYRPEILGRGELDREIRSPRYCGGMVDAESMALHPGEWTRGLAAAAERAGALLCSERRVRAIHSVPGGHQVSGEGFALRAREVLVATNGYTGGALPGLRARVVPLRSAIIATAPLGEQGRSLLPGGRLCYDSKWLLAYFRMSPDGRLIFGGRGSTSFRPALSAIERRLAREMTRVFPTLTGVAISHCWSGRVALCFDGLPHLGVHRGVHYALGYGGHGVSLSVALGEDAARMLAGERVESPFAERPPPTRFFYRGWPWFLPLRSAEFWVRDRMG